MQHHQPPDNADSKTLSNKIESSEIDKSICNWMIGKLVNSAILEISELSTTADGLTLKRTLHLKLPLHGSFT